MWTHFTKSINSKWNLPSKPCSYPASKPPALLWHPLEWNSFFESLSNPRLLNLKIKLYYKTIFKIKVLFLLIIIIIIFNPANGDGPLSKMITAVINLTDSDQCVLKLIWEYVIDKKWAWSFRSIAPVSDLILYTIFSLPRHYTLTAAWWWWMNELLLLVHFFWFQELAIPLSSLHTRTTYLILLTKQCTIIHTKQSLVLTNLISFHASVSALEFAQSSLTYSKAYQQKSCLLEYGNLKMWKQQVVIR